MVVFNWKFRCQTLVIIVYTRTQCVQSLALNFDRNFRDYHLERCIAAAAALSPRRYNVIPGTTILISLLLLLVSAVITRIVVVLLFKRVPTINIERHIKAPGRICNIIIHTRQYNIMRDP